MLVQNLHKNVIYHLKYIIGICDNTYMKWKKQNLLIFHLSNVEIVIAFIILCI